MSCSDSDLQFTTGILEGETIIISAKTSGIIVDIKKSEGSIVTIGDQLIQLDSSDYVLQFQQAQAISRQAKAQLNLAIQGARNEDIKIAYAALNSATINYEQAKKDADRLNELWTTKSISQKQWEDGNTRLKLTQSQLEQVDEHYKKAIHGSRQDEISLAKARYDQALSAEAIWRKKINDTALISPVNGIITSIGIKVGEYLNPGGQMLKISKLEKMTLPVYLPAGDLGIIKIGQSVVVMVDAFPDEIMTGTITMISETSEFTPKNIQTRDDRVKLVHKVKIELDNKELKLKSGMAAEVRY